MVMLIGDKPEIQPVSLFPDFIDKEMLWDDLPFNTLDRIKKEWPHIFDSKNLSYIPNLKLVNIKLWRYRNAYLEYINDQRLDRPHFMDFADDMFLESESEILGANLDIMNDIEIS
jgi:hypothetical protein